MKLIALRDFRNVPALRLKDADGKSLIKGARHDDQIHKGATFEIGSSSLKGEFAEQLAQLRKINADDAQVIAQLVMSGSVGDATDEKLVKAVKDEIAIEETREKNAAVLSAKAAASHIGEKILAALSAEPEPAKK